MIDHPDALHEIKHLDEVQDTIEQEKQIAQGETARALEALIAAREGDPDALPARELLYDSSLLTERNLARARRAPYFTRVDFVPQGGAHETHYIGRVGVLNTRTLAPVVIDWRAPIANLYYSGQLGDVSYQAPDGTIEGELKLKRQFTIADGRLEAIFDTDLVSRDQFLQSVLGAMTGERLKEIVTTIQAEQNYVIRYPLNASLIVQGVAGSGKTTIALHRIAYLLYAFQAELKPTQMLILAPNPLFLNFIAGVLPDLGVEEVRQSTFLRLMRAWLADKLPPIDEADRTATVVALSAADYEATRRVMQFKGSLRMDALLEKWLDEYEATFAERTLAFGPIQLYDAPALRQFLLVDEKPFPMERRLSEFQKQLTARARAAARRLNQWLEQECDRRLEKLIQTERDPERLAARRKQLVLSRDQRMKETVDQVRPYVRRVLSEMPTLDPAACYRAFLASLTESDDPDAREAARYTLKRLDAKMPHEPEDVAPIATIALRLTVLTREPIRHIVVDEAQDFGLMEFKLLTRFAPSASMTVVGDLMQGIMAFRGLNDWQALIDGVLGGRAQLHQLVTSYRSTTQIMAVALSVAARHPTPGQANARSVLRDGEAVRFVACDGADERACAIGAIARAWRDAGLQSIAIIARDGRGVRSLVDALGADLNARAMDVSADRFEAGVMVAPVSYVKGFEFDGVIVADADEATYPDDAMNARLLYVALTRALHRLAIVHGGKITQLLTSSPH